MASDKWIISGYDRPTAVRLYRSGFNSLVSVLLASRGISSTDEYEARLGTHMELSNPMQLPGMAAAVEAIRKAIEEKKKIAVYGDYDVDGMTSAVMVCEYLRDKGVDPICFIPERLRDGYGLKKESIDRLYEMGTEFIITVDCGITAVEEAEYIARLGIQAVITDHHMPGEVMPKAEAVVDPKIGGNDNPGTTFAGVGVAFKLVCALENDPDGKRTLERFSDILALGTIADVMPVTGENRTMIVQGLKKLCANPRPGIRALIKACGITAGNLNANTVGFTLAPRLNAAGRLGNTEYAVRLIGTSDEKEAEMLAAQLCDMNRQRQSIENEVMEQAKAMLPENPDGPVVVYGNDWHQGVAGIVASKLAESCGYPAVVICLKDGIGHGSCRGQGDFSIVDALQGYTDILENFGGHKLAAGLTIREENIPELKRRLNESYAAFGCNTQQETGPAINVDFEVVNPSILSEENVEGLKALEPFGADNPQPLLCMRGALVDMVSSLRGGKITKLWLRYGGESFEAMCFTKGPEQLGVTDGDIVDLIFNPAINEYRGRRNVQLVIKDLVKL